MNVIDIARKYEELKRSVNRHTEMQLVDNSELMIDNCGGMINCDENLIKLQLALNCVCITGLDLKLKNFGSNGIIITGSIKSISFEDQDYEK